MTDQLTDEVMAARQFYAEELRFTARIRSPAVVAAFAAVPREDFVGRAPWLIRSPMGAAEYWTTDGADPRTVYHDVLIALDAVRGINNGQPSLGPFCLTSLTSPLVNELCISVVARATIPRLWQSSSARREKLRQSSSKRA